MNTYTELKTKFIIFKSLHSKEQSKVQNEISFTVSAPLDLQIKKKKNPRHLQLRVRSKTRSNN